MCTKRFILFTCLQLNKKRICYCFLLPPPSLRAFVDIVLYGLTCNLHDGTQRSLPTEDASGPGIFRDPLTEDPMVNFRKFSVPENQSFSLGSLSLKHKPSTHPTHPIHQSMHLGDRREKPKLFTSFSLATRKELASENQASLVLAW